MNTTTVLVWRRRELDDGKVINLPTYVAIEEPPVCGCCEEHPREICARCGHPVVKA